MNKEEAIEQMIKDYKDGIQIAFTNFCLERTCAKCPFYHGCRDSVFNELFERILKAEEKKETNFDHYIANYCLVDYADKVTFKLKDGWKESRNDVDFKKWLASPYEKPKYKLTKFEYDLLECFRTSKYDIKAYYPLEQMQKKGHFKNVPADVPIRDILENCEVEE